MAEQPPAVLYDPAVRAGVALITLNRPKKLNAWNAAMAIAFSEALHDAAEDPEVRVVVVTGAGRGFCGGADLTDPANFPQQKGKDGVATQRAVQAKPRRPVLHPVKHMTSHPKIIVCAANGAVAGMGMVLALGSDIKFAERDAKWTTAFARRGLIAEHGLSYLLPQSVGTGHAMRLLVAAEVVKSDELYNMGLIQQLSGKGNVLEDALLFAADLARNVPPGSMAVIKKQVYTHPHLGLTEAMAQSDVLMRETLKTEDCNEGVKSYMEKRAPNFKPYDKQSSLSRKAAEVLPSKL
mmetsp:Transcript_125245/g.227174  ORF Transcript_125245/g.227174 Transcript_125245/m.227174 type:complete len:294 (-) Transcript_125245:106-987(-)